MKAANLLISNNGSSKIADYGLARSYDMSAALRGPGANGVQQGGSGGDTDAKGGNSSTDGGPGPAAKPSKKYTSIEETRTLLCHPDPRPNPPRSPTSTKIHNPSSSASFILI